MRALPAKPRASKKIAVPVSGQINFRTDGETEKQLAVIARHTAIRERSALARYAIAQTARRIEE